MEKKHKKRYVKPGVIKIPVDFKQLVKNTTSGGCPSVFVWDGANYMQGNSLLPNSEDLFRKEKVLNDYYVLKNELQPKDGFFSFKIKELVEDVAWFNKFELLCVEGKADYSIGYTPGGRLLSYCKPCLPVEIKDKEDNDISAKIYKSNLEDTAKYFCGKAGDEMYLDFGKVNSNFAKLVIVDPKAYAQDGWGCINVHGKMSIYITLYINAHWEDIAVLHTRAEFYPDIIDLTPYLPEINGDLKIRLEFTAHHKVSFVGIDTSEPIRLKTKTYPLVQAIHTEFGDVTEILRGDKDEFVRLYPGESIELKFPVPEPPKPGHKLSYVLYSKGYYIPTTKLMSLARQGELTSIGSNK
jgi:hypothetical protein